MSKFILLAVLAVVFLLVGILLGTVSTATTMIFVTAGPVCSEYPRVRTLTDALRIGRELRSSRPLITVHADCEFDGLTSIMQVGLSLEETDGKTEPEIWELFDREVDGHIASRLNSGHWCESFESGIRVA